MPEATLAAIVIVAVSGMVKVGDFRWLYKVNRVDFALALVAFLAVLTFEEILVGLMVAVIISLLALVGRASQSRISVLGRVPGSIQFGDVKRYPQNLEVPGLLIVRPDEGIFFANASSLRAVIHRMVLQGKRPFRTVLIDLEMSNELDASSIHELHELHKDLTTLDTRMMLSRVHPKVQDTMDRSELTEVIGKENIYSRGMDAVVVHLQQDGQDSAVILEMAADVLSRTKEALDAAALQSEDKNQQKIEAVRKQLHASIETLNGPIGEINDGK